VRYPLFPLALVLAMTATVPAYAQQAGAPSERLSPRTERILDEMERTLLFQLRRMREAEIDADKGGAPSPDRALSRADPIPTLSPSPTDWLIVLYGPDGSVAAHWRLVGRQVYAPADGRIAFVDNKGRATTLSGAVVTVDVGSWRNGDVDVAAYGIKGWKTKPAGE